MVLELNVDRQLLHQVTNEALGHQNTYQALDVEVQSKLSDRVEEILFILGEASSLRWSAVSIHSKEILIDRSPFLGHAHQWEELITLIRSQGLKGARLRNLSSIPIRQAVEMMQSGVSTTEEYLKRRYSHPLDLPAQSGSLFRKRRKY